MDLIFVRHIKSSLKNISFFFAFSANLIILISYSPPLLFRLCILSFYYLNFLPFLYLDLVFFPFPFRLFFPFSIDYCISFLFGLLHAFSFYLSVFITYLLFFCPVLFTFSSSITSILNRNVIMDVFQVFSSTL